MFFRILKARILCVYKEYGLFIVLLLPKTGFVSFSKLRAAVSGCLHHQSALYTLSVKSAAKIIHLVYISVGMIIVGSAASPLFGSSLAE